MTPNTESERLDIFGTRLVKRLSKRMSHSSGSKENATTETAGGSSIGQQALDKGGGFKDQNTQGNWSGVQEGSQTENTKTTTNQSGTAGALGDIQSKPEDIGSRVFGHRRSVSRYDYNDDIKKGPITKRPGYMAEGISTAIGSGAALAGAAAAFRRAEQSAGAAEVDQRDASQAGMAGGGGSSSQGMTQSASDKLATGDPLGEELEEQGHISSDVFSSGTSNEAAARGLSGSAGATEADHAPKTALGEELEQQGHISSDVFASGASNEAAARGLSGHPNATEADHAPKTIMGDELEEQGHIGSDVFRSGASNDAATRGLSGNPNATEADHAPKTIIGEELEEQGHIDSDIFSSGASNDAAARGLSGIEGATDAEHAPKTAMGDELEEQGHIGSDLFSSGASNEAAAKGLSGNPDATEADHAPKTTLGNELEEQGHIGSDVFSSGGSNEAASRGLSGSKDATEATHAPKSSFSKSSQGWSTVGGPGLGAMGVGALGAGLMGAGGGYKQDLTQRDIRQSTFTGGSTTAASTTMDTSSGIQSSRVVTIFSGSSYKVTILQERIQAVAQKCKNQLGVSASEISKPSPTVDAFFDVVATERLRWMPTDGSKLDCCLRWASRLAYAVDALRESIGAFAPGANEAAKLIWGFEVLLLESDVDNTDVFESIFGRYGRVAVGIYLLLQYESAFKTNPELQPQAAAVYADLLEMICSTTASCIEGFKSKEPEHSISHHVDAAFVTYARRYATHWNDIVEAATSKLVLQSSLISSSPEVGSLRQFLGVQDRPLQFILDSRAHSLAEGSFEWFNNVLYDFTVGKSPMMIVKGGAGSGKSAMAQWIVERLQESAEHDHWSVIPYTIRADIPVATLPLRILKGILHQMLDHCVSDTRTQEAILVQVDKAAQGALMGAGETEVEECLWEGIRTGLSSNIQYMFVVDGMDQIKGGDTDAVACLERFARILSEKNATSKMIAFTRPLKSRLSANNVFQFTMQTSQTGTDLKAYVHKLLSGTQFDGLKDDQLDSTVSVIVNRSRGSFSWAEMAVEYAKEQRTLSQAVSSVQSLPQSMPELLDFHMKNLDLKQKETKCILSWLAAAERPLLVEEVEQLLAIDPSGSRSTPSLSHDEDQWFSALRPLVMTRDGVVSFAHTCIRDHVIKLARSSSTKSPLNLKEAHYDLLTRCLAWVQLNLREEAEISMDKLSMDERNRLFDKYVVLEYTARYWLSHLLSSPLVTDDGEFHFPSSFKKLVPPTVLFARLELTCQESQFTRSSVVELYRLATDIRRLVLGDKSLALLQSLLLSARVSKLAHVSYTDEHCYEAWRLSQELLGQSDIITLTCAEMMTQSFTERGTMTTQQEEIMKYLILTDSEITGVEFNQRLKYLGLIVGMYKARGDKSSALLVSRQFYQQIIDKYGTNSRQSSETADFLTGQFSTTGSDEMSRDIARTKYDNVVRTMDVTDDRRIKYTLYMAQLYEQHGEKAQAQGVLSSLWAGLNSRDIDSVAMMDKKTNVALVYYQFLRRQGHSDEAEVIIRELVADLEVTGVHSKEMMQRVNLLRAETREMHLYNLDHSLSVLMWRYYKETNQEYSPAATSLALTIAQSMANAVSIEDTNVMSTRDRKLMVELLDSITSSSNNLSVSTMILCHNLASIYVREDDWVEASDCSKAVLQHVWPTVEQTGSYKKFSTELAPPIADLALLLAYCHFRRLHLDQATIVYENAFGSLISSDRVAVASVLAVAKAVVEFYETTFQFPKALTLLHTVSSFLTARLGQNHKNTIENMYLEAALASRLEMNHEARSAYQRIYENTLRGKTIAPEGLEAALALVGLYEKELQWDSALDVYRHLWPTLVVQDSKHTYDRVQVEKLLEKTYLGYMSILTTRTRSTDFSERYQVASDYVSTCRNVYGPTHENTLNATLLFAELCETSDAYTDHAISLYKKPLQTSEWVPTSESSKGLEQMTLPLPITLKHKLAQLFVRRRASTSEARSLYTEEYQLARKTQGYFSTTTLSWLRELALAHSRQATLVSIQQGNALLHAYVTDVIHAGADPDMMGDWARKIAAIYLECGFIDGGNSILDELRTRVVTSPDTSAMAVGDRRDAVFVAAFEEVFGRRASSDQIMTEMAREMQTQQAFSKCLSGHDFIPTLVTGDRLARLQTDQHRTRAATDTRKKLYEYFCTTLSATKIANRDIVKQFYGICLREVHNDNYSYNILTTTTSLIRDLCNSSSFQDASDLTGVLHSFLHLTDSLNNYDSIITSTKICLYLSGHQATKCHDEKLYNEMSVKSKLLLQELMAASKAIGIEIVDLPFTQLNDIITLLGEYEMFDELEAILTQLWTSRIVQRTWTPDVVVWIGRRLVETRFCRGSVDSSIQLCRDICYNLRQVWGSCDNVTLEMTKLLSGLFTASDNHQAAATLHEGVLYDLLSDSDAKDHPDAADTASQHMELLRRAQTRLGVSKSPTRESAHAELIAQVTERFGLQDAQIEGVGDKHGGEAFGVWAKPRRFSIDVEDLDGQGQGQQMHHNHLRETSGVGLLDGNGAPRRLSVQAL